MAKRQNISTSPRMGSLDMIRKTVDATTASQAILKPLISCGFSMDTPSWKLSSATNTIRVLAR
ncbi:MAG: hypothetical protein ABI210_13140, partial [Abditibacteriaceae bacterium]